MKKASILLFLVFIVLFSFGSSASIFPKHLYVYWDSNIQQAPLLVQMCVEKMRMACAQSNWNFTILSDDNLHQYLPDYYQKFLPVKDNPKRPTWKANLADLVRLAIIDQKGGMYLDVSTVLFRGLGWFDRIQDYPYLLLNSQLHQGQEPQAMQFTFTHYQNIVQTRDPDRGITNFEPGYESWCYIAKPKSPYIKALRERFSHHYIHTAEENNMEEFEKDYYNRGIYSDYLKIHKATFELIQQTQFNLDKNLTLFGERTNVNHHFKLVGIRAEYGPFTFLVSLVPMEKLFTHTLQQINEQDQIPMYFFLKLTSQDRPYVEQQLQQLFLIFEKYQNITRDFDDFLKAKPSIDKCQKLKFIVEGSVMGLLVKNNKVAIKSNIVPISVEQRQKWWDYCKQSFNIETNFTLSPDVRISQIINRWVMPFTQKILSEQFNSKLRILLKKIAVLCAYSIQGFWGGFSDVQQTEYWQKVFQKRNPQIKNPTPNSDDQFVQGKSLDDYSFVELLQLRIKLYVAANRTTLSYKLKIFIFFLFFASFIALIFSAVTLIAKVFFWEVKPSYSLGAMLWRCITRKKQRRNICISLKKVPSKNYTKLKDYFTVFFANIKSCNPFTFFFQIFAITLNYLVKKILIFLLSLAFLAYNAIVFFKYYHVIFFGQIYNQELTLLIYIVVQIIFRKTFEKIGKDVWGLPGLTLGQLQYILNPVYIFSLGASLLVMAERTEIRNLALSVSLCMILPVLAHELDLQLKTIIKLFGLTEAPQKVRNHHLKTVAKVAMKILGNFTDSIEIAVMAFLGMNVILPNLRFIVYNDEMYAVKKFLHSLESLLIIFIVLLMLLFSAELFKKIRKITQQIKALKMEAEELEIQTSDENPDTTLENMTDEMVQKLEESSQPDNCDVQANEVKKWQIPPQIYRKIITVSSRVIFYSLKMLLYCLLVFTNWSQILVSNTVNISLSQQLHNLEYLVLPLRLMSILAIFFISFSLEKIIEESYIKVAQDKENSENYIDFKEQSEENGSTIYKKEQNKRTAHPILGRVVLISLSMFLLIRLILFDRIYEYLMAVDKKELYNKVNLEKQLVYYLGVFVVTACAFKLIRQIVTNCSKAKLKKVKQDQFQIEELLEDLQSDMPSTAESTGEQNQIENAQIENSPEDTTVLSMAQVQ